MKLLLPIAVSLLLPAFNLPAYAQRGQAGHSQGARPAQQQSRPAPQQQRQARQAPRQQAQQARPAPQQAPQARPAQQPQRQQVARLQQQQAHPVARAPQGNPKRSQAQAQPAQPAGRSEGGHGRISNEHYESHFGNRHSFHVNRGDYDHRRFYYGGYGFAFVDPWPFDWGYSDDVYVEYHDGGYYMYDRFHPGVRIAINIL